MQHSDLAKDYAQANNQEEDEEEDDNEEEEHLDQVNEMSFNHNEDYS